MASIRGSDTKPELLLRRALWRAGVRGWRCHSRGPGGRIDIAFTRWKLAVLVDGSFWHGHPSKWQPGRWSGYWDAKIKRNLARDATQNEALRAGGWEVFRVWDFEIEHDADVVASTVAATLARLRARQPEAATLEPAPDESFSTRNPPEFGPCRPGSARDSSSHR
jgi:DNA mismatch endonuclease (patch repair protein)